MSAKCTK